MPTIVIPWRDTGPERARACAAVQCTLRRILPGIPQQLTDSGHEPFNRAASRNLGVSQLPDDEVAVVCDADVLPDPGSLSAAIHAASDGNMHYPFTTCLYLTKEATEDVLAGHVPCLVDVEFCIPGAQGGLMVMLASAWRQVGGMDERYTGWGYEDNAWYRSVTSAIGYPVRHPGNLYHLWHPSDRNTVSLDEARNLARFWGRVHD